MAHPDILGDRNVAPVGGRLIGEQGEEGALARPIRPDNPHPFAPVDAERHIVQHLLGPESHGNISEINHDGRQD